MTLNTHINQCQDAQVLNKYVKKLKVCKKNLNHPIVWHFIHKSNMQGGFNKVIASLFVPNHKHFTNV